MTWEGAEIGMVTTPPTRVEDVKDPIGITGWPKEKGRDGERTPMQWTPGKNAGFSTADKTWLPVAPDYKTVNVEVEQKDPNSLLVFNEKLIALRRTNPALRDGKFTVLDESNPNVLSYARTASDGKAVIVALNMTGQPQTITLDPTPRRSHRQNHQNHPDQHPNPQPHHPNQPHPPPLRLVGCHPPIAPSRVPHP